MTCIVDIMRMKRTKHLWFAELTVVTFYCGDQITVCPEYIHQWYQHT